MKTYSRKRLVHQEIKEVLDRCRLCLRKPEQEVPIFKDSQDVCAVLAMRIMICVGLEMTYEDFLPNKICMNCYEELEKYYKFRRKCQLSFHQLKSHALAIKDKSNELKDEKILFPITKIPLDEDLEQFLVENKELSAPQSSEVNENVANLKDDIMEEVQIPIPAEMNPDIATFLTTVFMELGILVRQDDGLVVQDQGITSFELETGNDEQLVLELVEEDEGVVVFTEKNEPQQIEEVDTPDEKLKTELTDVSLKQNRKGAKKTCGAWCAQCGRVFSSAAGARRHAASAAAHGAARAHACRTCRRAFAQRAALTRHLLVHLEERPFKCASCPKSFTQRGALRAHARAHAAPPARALALHRCALCDKLFLYASGLSRHMMTHTGRIFECSACGKQFNDKSSLLRHMKKTHPVT